MTETDKNIMQDGIKLKGRVTRQLFDEAMKLVYEDISDNLVVTSGIDYLATWLTASTQSTPFMSYMALGTGNTAPVVGNTALQSELSGGGYSRVQGTLTNPSPNIWQNVTTFGPGNGTGALTEAGIFSTSTLGTMLARNVFSTINKASGNTLIITWQISIS
jgi:hypothetical protein